MDDRAPRHAQAVEPVPVQNPDLARLKDISYFDKAEVLTRVIIMGVLSVALAYWKDDQTYLWLYAAYFLMSSAAIILVRRAPDTMTQRAFSLYSLLGNMPMLALLVASVYLWMDPDVFLQMMAVALLFSLLISMLMIRSVDAVVFNWDAGGMAITMAILVLIDVERFGLAGRPVVSALMFAGAFAYFLHCASVIVRVRRSLDDAQVMEVQRSKIEAIGRLTGGVAHDFNNLLTVILGNIELAKLADTPREQNALLGEAEDAGQRAARLTAQLLAFSRQSRLNPERVNVDQSLTKTEALLARLFPPNIDVNVTADAALHVAVDVDSFETVLLNLCINARDAMPEGGRLCLRVHRTTVSGDTGEVAAGVYAVITVTDNGIGMTADVLARVTEPFYTTKPVGQGSGLGLSMAKGFAEQSGGRLTLTSVPGRGTEVAVWLPLVD